MAARVDIRQMQVRDGDLSLPFAANCGAGTAVLDPLGQPSKLRTLRWGEKCRLARYADADPAFLEAQFLAICSDGAPDDAARRAALVALALWLGGTAAPPLPLDPTVLGGVTLGLCRALGISPVQLDEMAVPEVEALWLALGLSDTATADADPVADGVTRIVIEPDPIPATDGVAEPAPDTVPHGDKATDRSLPQPRTPAASPRTTAGQTPGHTRGTAPTAPRTASAAPAPAEPSPASDPGAKARPGVARGAATPASPRSLDHGSPTRSPTPRFRIGTPPTPLPPALPATSEAGPLPAPTTAVVEPLRLTPAASAAGAASVRRSVPPVGGDVRAAASVPVAAAGASTPAGGEPAAAALEGRLGALIEIVARAASHRHAAPPDPDTSLESFGDRLAEAVNELGLTGAE